MRFSHRNHNRNEGVGRDALLSLGVFLWIRVLALNEKENNIWWKFFIKHYFLIECLINVLYVHVCMQICVCGNSCHHRHLERSKDNWVGEFSSLMVFLRLNSGRRAWQQELLPACQILFSNLKNIQSFVALTIPKGYSMIFVTKWDVYCSTHPVNILIE